MILDVAVHGKEKPVPLSDVAKRQNISFKYLEQLTSKLRKAEIIKSHRGPFGGHMLAKHPDKITIGEIVRILEASTAITDCAEQDKKLCGVCNRAGDCLSRWVWVEASKAMFDRLDQITIGSLLKINNVEIKS